MADRISNTLSDDEKAQGPASMLVPDPGEDDPQKLKVLHEISLRFGLHAAAAMHDFIGINGEDVEESERLYRMAHQDGTLKDTRPTMNRIKKTFDSQTAAALRTGPVFVWKALSSSEDGHWVMKKPFRISAAELVDKATGQPKIDPRTDQPYQDVDLPFNSEIPEELIDFVPSHRRVKIDADAIVRWEQATFDAMCRICGVDEVAWRMYDHKLKTGWLPVYYEFDESTQRHVFRFYPLLHWKLDPVQSDVGDMSKLRIDIVRDAMEATRYEPLAEDAVRRAAMLSVMPQPGANAYSSVYTSVSAYATPIITYVKMYMRNVPVAMTLDEADAAGVVKIGEDNTVMHGDTDVSAGFDGRGAVNRKKMHTKHPRHFVTVEWVEINGVVVPETYRRCPHWDIPVILDKTSEIMWRPYADPETIILKSPQFLINRMYEKMANHVDWFAGIAGFMSRDLQQQVGDDATNLHAHPDRILTVDIGSLEGGDLSKHFLQFKPPELTAAIPQVLNIVTRDYERIGEAAVQSGSVPPGVTAASAIAQLQQTANTTGDFKTHYSQRALWRMAMLMMYKQQRAMTLEEILRVNKTLPAEIVRTWVWPERLNVEMDCEVQMATGGGMVKQQADQRAINLFTVGLLDEETAQDRLGEDSEEIGRRKLEKLKEQAEVAAKNAPQGPQKPPFNFSVSAPLQVLSPQDQSAALQAVGLPGSPVQPPISAPVNGNGQTKPAGRAI